MPTHNSLWQSGFGNKFFEVLPVKTMRSRTTMLSHRSQNSGLTVVMVGDGIDDSPALVAAAAFTGLENSTVPFGNKKVDDPIIVIDNYDSFTYNLFQYMGGLGCNFEVYRNDELTVEELKRKNPRGVLISPGPGAPQDSGISLQTVLELEPIVPLFGVCMGLQCIGEAFGGKIVRSPFGVMHGKSSLVYYDEKGEEGLLSGLPKQK